MTEELRIIDIRQTLIKSIATDAFSIGIVLLGFYINHAYLGNGLILQWAMAILFFVVVVKYGSKRIKKVATKEEAIKHIESLFQNNNQE